MGIPRRNIGILAHIDAGKTTVTEHLLHLGGAMRRAGSVDAGTTVTDWMLEEQERGITIASAAVVFPWRGVDITVIDTPGHVDFTIEVERSLRVLDGAVLVISGPDGVQAQTETVWNQAARRRLPVIAFINKLDRPGLDVERLQLELEERLGTRPLPMQIVREIEGDRIELLDVIEGRRRRWTLPDHGSRDAAIVEDMPLSDADVDARVEALERIVDAVASHDDAFAELVLSGGTPSTGSYYAAVAAAVRARAVLPLAWGVARHGAGLSYLADLVLHLLPPPGPTVAFDRAQQSQVLDLDGAAAAFVFKTEPRRRGVSLAFVRCFAGRIESTSPLLRTPDGTVFGGARLVAVSGQDYEAVAALEAGAVGAIAFESGPLPRTGDTLGHTLLPYTFEKILPPDAVIEVSVEAPDPDGHERMMTALRALCADDPSLRLATDRETGAAVLAGMGELHLEVAVERAARACGMALRSGSPKARTRWLLPRASEGSSEVHQPTSRARVGVLVIVRPGAGGVRIACTLERDDWREALVAGITAALGHDGVSARHVIDVEVEVKRVDTHGGDLPTPVQFRDAAQRATDHALLAGGIEEGEPWGTLVVTVPDPAVGRVVGDLARRRTRIRRTESRGNMQEIVAEAPLGELIGYATALRNMTAGRAVFTVEPTGYRPRTGRV